MKNKFISSIWDFSQLDLSQTNYITHDFLRWYGKLVPQLVSRLLKIYSEEGDTVLANFAGSGTVLVEANLLKRDVIGIDSSPLSNLLCKVKTTPIIPETATMIQKLEEKFKVIHKNDFPMDAVDKKWFWEESFQELNLIKETIEEVKNENQRDFFLLALASIVRKASLIDSRCVNHIVVDKNKPKIDVLEEFRTQISEMEQSMEAYLKLRTDSSIIIEKGDARDLSSIKEESIDFIISHPPYLGYINYSNIYKLSNKILGYEYKDVKKGDISTGSLNKYMEAMKKCFDEMRRVIKPDKYVSVIIGDNRVDGEIVPTFSYFIDYAKTLGFKLVDIFIWILSRKAGMGVKRRGNHIDHNYILIFKKH